MADELQIHSASNMRKILKGERAIGKKLGHKIAECLTTNRTYRKYIKRVVDLKNSASVAEQERLLREILSLKRHQTPVAITEEQEELHSEWYHFVVWELLALPGIDQSPKNIANLLQPKIRTQQVTRSIQLLLKLGLVQFNPETMRLEVDRRQIETGADSESLLLIKYHQQILDVTKNSIAKVDKSERDLSTSTFRLKKERIKEIKQQIYDFQLKLIQQESEPEDADQIFQFNFQLIPVTAVVSQKEEEKENLGKSA